MRKEAPALPPLENIATPLPNWSRIALPDPSVLEGFWRLHCSMLEHIAVARGFRQRLPQQIARLDPTARLVALSRFCAQQEHGPGRKRQLVRKLKWGFTHAAPVQTERAQLVKKRALPVHLQLRLGLPLVLPLRQENLRVDLSIKLEPPSTVAASARATSHPVLEVTALPKPKNATRAPLRLPQGQRRAITYDRVTTKQRRGSRRKPPPRLDLSRLEQNRLQ